MNPLKLRNQLFYYFNFYHFSFENPLILRIQGLLIVLEIQDL